MTQAAQQLLWPLELERSKQRKRKRQRLRRPKSGELSSVWVGRKDAPLLETMFRFYEAPPGPVIDVSCRHRRLWHGMDTACLPGPLICCDADPDVRPDIQADWNRLPFAAESAAAIVWDPPHFANDSTGGPARGEWQARYGIGTLPEDCNTSLDALYRPLLEEAHRVLMPKGLLLTKLCDHVRCRRHQWILCDYITAVRAVPGQFSPVDVIVKVRPPGPGWKGWKKKHHARCRHTWWVVVRKGGVDEYRR